MFTTQGKDSNNIKNEEQSISQKPWKPTVQVGCAS
jgi:hypothetical protein